MSKKKILISIFLLTCLGKAEDIELSYGLGLGALYNGIGINIASIQNEDVKYLSLGCTDISHSTYTGLDSSCGLGIGYINTNFLSDSIQHGLGIHFAINNESSDNNIEFLVGTSYTYFINSSKKGLNFGLTPFVAFKDKKDNELSFLLDIGYQF